MGEAESVGTIHNQRVRIRDIQTRLDNRRAQQHIDVTMPEIADDLVELLTSHLAMGNAYPGFGNEVLQTLGLLLYALDTVVDVEHLTAAATVHVESPR